MHELSVYSQVIELRIFAFGRLRESSDRFLLPGSRGGVGRGRVVLARRAKEAPQKHRKGEDVGFLIVDAAVPRLGRRFVYVVERELRKCKNL